MRGGRRFGLFRVDLPKRKYGRPLPRPLVVVGNPVSVEPTRPEPQRLECLAHASIRVRVPAPIDAQIPLDSTLKRGPLQIARANERHAKVRRLEPPGLWMKDTALGGQTLDFDHPGSQTAAGTRLGLGRRELPIEEKFQCA